MELKGIEFSENERRVLDYFRPAAAGKWRRGAIFELTFIAISLGLAVVYVVHGDAGAGFVAYALLLWRAWSALWNRRRYVQAYRGIFSKYQARLKDFEHTSMSGPHS